MTTVPAGDAELIDEEFVRSFWKGLLKKDDHALVTFNELFYILQSAIADRLAAANERAEKAEKEYAIEKIHAQGGYDAAAQLKARAEAAEARLAEVTAERDAARKSNREARRLIQSTHKRAITHTNCERQSCPICDGGLFMCADCGAAEIEAEERICTAAEARIAELEARLRGQS